METESVKTTVVIVTYNCENVISDCLESLQHQNKCEIIVVDNNSKDTTLSKMAKFSNLILIENNKNNGFTKACNQAIKQAKGEYIFLLNPDTIIKQNTIDLLITTFESDKIIGMVAPQLLFPNGKVQNYIRRFPSISGVLVESFIPHFLWKYFKTYRNYTCQDLDLSISQFVEQPAGAALLFKKNVFLDENYFIYGSDVELCKNIIDTGYKIKTVPEAHVIHHQSMGGTDSENIVLKTKLQLDYYFAMRYFLKKHKGLFYAFLYVTLSSLFLLASVSFSILKFDLRIFKLKCFRLVWFLQNKNFASINYNE